MASPTVLDLMLLPRPELVEADVVAVVEAFLADPGLGFVTLGLGHRIDLVGAVNAHPFARTLVDEPWASVELRRAAVRAAILLTRPERSATAGDERSTG